MKTKTIYHFDHDCNVVRVEVIEKKKKKKRSMIMNIERMIENVQFISINDFDLTIDLQTPLIQKEPLQYEPSKKVSRADYIDRCFALIRFDNNLPEGWIARPYSAKKKQDPS